MINQAEHLAVEQTIVVEAAPERAFAVFTEGLGTWWPLDNYAIGAKPATSAVVEPRVGGRWYERAADGTECAWGHVLAWDPPHRLVLTWEISCDFRPDAGVASEVEVRFQAEAAGRTRVELVHRGLEVYGERAQEMRDTFGSPDGWAGLLRRFGDAV